MEKWIKLLSVVAIWLLAACMSSYYYAGDTTVNLMDALATKRITATVTGAGGYSGNCLNVKLVNLQDTEVKINVPAGTMFKPSDAGAQNILITQDQILALKPGATQLMKLRGYCCEATDHSPSKDMAFSISTNKDAKMQKLFAHMKGKAYPDNAIQEAVWCISNGHEASNIYIDDYDKVKPLREAVCTITGQKDTWYSTPKEHQVDDEGNISHETVTVTGFIKFKALKNAKVHNEVHDATGKLIIRNPNEFDIIPGNIEYEFGIRVGGWQKGTYYVYVYENENVIHKQEFKI